MSIVVRSARREELERVNELRRQVNEVHVSGRPDVFRPGFGEELQKHLYDRFEAPDADVIVAVREGKILGFAIAEVISRPLSAYNLPRSFYHVEEFGVDENHRREGVGTALVDFIKQSARNRGLKKIELNMWEFNQGALRFYEQAGFQTTRRYMELSIEDEREP